ncbi:hypothetical protein [Synechococcus sp. Cu2B8-bc1011]|uniref:hypothetical protein n=2 Tax=Synechococcus TaxID=1129 RepID=UPI0039B095DF
MLNSVLDRTSTMVQSAPNQKQEHLAKADVFFQQAQSAAEAGDVSSSGSFILKALEQERRAGTVGPQVMQLIKPRS